jgi:hypothetical protein
MNHRSLVVVGALAATAFTAACMSTTGVSAPRPFSYIDVHELPASNSTGLVPYASAIFIKDRVTGVVPSNALGESCSGPVAITSTDGSGVPASSANLDPGSVMMTVKGTVDTTTRTVPLTATGISNGLLQYTNQTAPALTAGTDSIKVAAAGQAGGFPPFSITAASVPHFVAQPVDDSITGQGIRVQWTGLDAASPTRMQISLQFSDGKSSTPNFETRCVAYDDGDFTIPRSYLTGWEDAGVDSLKLAHQAVLSRFITVGANVADGIAVIVARIDTTIVK